MKKKVSGVTDLNFTFGFIPICRNSGPTTVPVPVPKKLVITPAINTIIQNTENFFLELLAKQNAAGCEDSRTVLGV